MSLLVVKAYEMAPQKQPIESAFNNDHNYLLPSPPLSLSPSLPPFLYPSLLKNHCSSKATGDKFPLNGVSNTQTGIHA